MSHNMRDHAENEKTNDELATEGQEVATDEQSSADQLPPASSESPDEAEQMAPVTKIDEIGENNDNAEEVIEAHGELYNDSTPPPDVDTIPLDEEDTPAMTGSLPIPPVPEEPFIQVAQRCDMGVVRKRNEDSCFSFVSLTGGQEPLIPFALCLVADGMGGHHAGHEASRTVAFQVAQHVMEKIYLPLMRGQTSSSPIQEVVQEAVEIANRSIHTSDPDKEGGTTLTGCVIVGRRMYLVHVGDSRGYLFTDDGMKLMTTDHSIVQRLQEAGHITAEQAATHPHRNLLYRAVTGNDLEVDTYNRALPKRGYLLLCSDGLWGSIEDPQIQEVVRDESLTLQERCEKLVQMAIDGGSTDNVTGMLIRFRL